MSSTSVGGSIISGSESNTSSGGLGAGIDVSLLVQAAMSNQQAELQLLQGQQTTLANQQTALTSFQTDVETLQTAAFALTDPVSSLTQMAATTSDSSVLTASAVTGATGGSYSVVVNNLATTSSYYSAALASSTTTLPNGTLSISVGGATAVPIAVNNSNNTLSGLATAINNANIGVTANVITDATGSRLSIVSNTSGAPGDLTVTATSGLPAMTKAVTGVNASLTLNNIPIQSTTNTVTTAINGVTLNLTNANPNETVTLNVGPDVTSAENAINSFVSAYNTVVGDLNTQFAVDPSTGAAGPLASDSTVSLTQSQILSSAAFAMTGNGNINSLADLGISFNNDGTLSVDSGALTSALTANFASVQNLFQATAPGSFGANLSQSLTAVADPITGSIAQDLTGLQQTQNDLTGQITDFQSQMSDLQTSLTQQYDQVDTTLQELPLLLQQVNQQLASLG
jgi:flagellar hook-associated protein 2